MERMTTVVALDRQHMTLGLPGIGGGLHRGRRGGDGPARSSHSHVRHFMQQAQNFFARASSCSVRPLLGMAGGTIIKRRLIML